MEDLVSDYYSLCASFTSMIQYINLKSLTVNVTYVYSFSANQDILLFYLAAIFYF